MSDKNKSLTTILIAVGLGVYFRFCGGADDKDPAANAPVATQVPAKTGPEPPPSPPPKPKEMTPEEVRCGMRPALGPMDGEVIGSEAFLAKAANDPDSVDVENCFEPVMSQEMCWTTVCDVRQKNAFGAMMLSRVRFYVMHGRVIGAKPERLPR